MTERDLAKALNEKLQSAGLLRYVVPGKQQLFAVPDGFFIELVLKDASKLDDGENLVASVRREVERKGIHLFSIVRALWVMREIQKLDQSRGGSGGIKAATDFRVILESGLRKAEPVVEVTDAAITELERKLGSSDQILKAAVREFVKLQLSYGGSGYWDPLRHPIHALDEAAASYLLARGLLCSAPTSKLPVGTAAT